VTRIRAVVITQEDPFYVAEFFRTFGGLAPRPDAEIVGALILDTLGQRTSGGLLRKMHGLYGSLGVVRLASRYARKKIRAVVRDLAGVGPPVMVRQLLADQGIPVEHVADINAPEGLAALRRLRPDVVLSVAATQKFSPEVLAVAAKGCFNTHSGDLPRFRGMMPTFWTLYENEPNATVTVHRMSEKIDAGEIWGQERIPIAPGHSLDDVIIATKRLSASMMARLLGELARGDVELHENDGSRKSHYRFPTAKDSAELRRRGRRLL